MFKKGIKGIIAVLMALCFSLPLFACGGGNNPPNKLEVKTISASLLSGKVANLMEADGVGMIEKEDSTRSATPFNEDNTLKQKKSEFAKSTARGVSDVFFHDMPGGARKHTYKDFNKKYEKHHHEEVECEVVDCDQISDEIMLEELSGTAKTIISLESRLNKLYSYGGFTFVSVSSAVTGEIDVRAITSSLLVEESKAVFGYHGDSIFPTYVNVENNFNQNKGGYVFAFINIPESEDTVKGMIPIKSNTNEEDYHSSNYWCDEYNQSYIIDNATGMTYSLEQFKYIYSVKEGIVKIFDKTIPGDFRYYVPEVNDGELSFKELDFYSDSTFANNINGARIHSDIYGNFVFEKNVVDPSDSVDLNGEKKISDKAIFSMVNKGVFNTVESSSKPQDRQPKKLLLGYNYHKGSDGRLYRIDTRNNVSGFKVSVLDENCAWQKVGSDVNVTFTDAQIAWDLDDLSTDWDCLQLTKIANGYAYYTNVAFSDGRNLFPQATYINDYDKNKFMGMVKIPVDGLNDGELDLSFITYVREIGCNLKKKYSLSLLGPTQVLYIAENDVGVWDFETDQKVEFSFSAEGHYVPTGADVLYVDGLGYIEIGREIELSSFGKQSFSSENIKTYGEFEEYYKLILGMR